MPPYIFGNLETARIHGKISTAVTASSPKSKSPSIKSRLLDLPAEIHLHIFEYLDAVTSTSFGLTCKALYPLHRKLHGSVRLDDHIFWEDSEGRAVLRYLGHVLKEWAGRRSLICSIRYRKIMTKEQLEKRKQEDFELLKSNKGW